MCIKGKIISSLGVSVLAFNVLLSTPIFANEHEASLEIQNDKDILMSIRQVAI